MKLFTQYSRINLFANLAIFLVASVAFYFSIRFVLVHQIDEDLQIEENEITAFVKEHNRLPESFSVSDQVINFSPAVQAVQRNFTTVKMQRDSEEESFRRLVFGITAQETSYRATVSKSLEGTDSLLHSILLVSVCAILLILFASFIINRIVLKKLWQPFYASLNAVKSFRPSKEAHLPLPVTSSDEFSTMNETLQTITRSSRLDYLSLKTFSENASHEIQTPIAIIRSKLDLLIQDEQLTEAQSKTVQSAYNAVEKLSRLNNALLLLAKIENNQFENLTQVDIKEKLEEKLEDFQELWQAKGITLHANLQPAFVTMNTELADILLNNLVSNAIHHNGDGGSIWIDLMPNALTIRNTGTAVELDSKQLFRRFYKHSASNSLNGLGLSIIKQIADASGFGIRYHYDGNLHSFTIRFHNNK